MFFINLVKEDTDSIANPIIKKIWLPIYAISTLHFHVFYHILVYMSGNQHVTTPKFPPMEKRFSKEQIKGFKPLVRELLSHSHKTEEDVKKFCIENDYEKEMRYCEKCKADKPYSMSHCSTCKRCTYRLDHHCPWVNNCVSMENNKIFLSFLVW
mmetsp:Transcript_4428/g.4122  ORF Transcript_4428/g.4122 Transcript_4428/m.4122 type:complete len:154 (+) Transcript_4428:109-570(+)